MRRAQIDKYSQAVRNLANNPAFETANGTVTTHTNLAQNPSFETTSGTVDVRTNLFTNPAFEATNGNVEVRANLIPNPSFEGASGTNTVRTNLITNPSMEAAGTVYTTRTNLVPNPNFEVDTTNTQVYGSTLSRSTTEKMTGTASASFTVTTTGAYAQLGTPNASMPVSANTAYTWSAYVKAGTTARPIAPRVLFYDAAGAMLTDVTLAATTVSTTAWTRISQTITSPAGAVTAAARVVTMNNATDTVAGEVFYTDGWLFEAANGVLPYFDGAVPAHENLAKTAPAAQYVATHTTGVSYAGSTWTRISTPAGTSQSLTRQFVDLVSLRQNETYTTAVTVANDTSSSVTIYFDWADVGNVTHVLAPGEQKRITSKGFRATGYSDVYRFADLHIQQASAEAKSILFKDWLIELGDTSGDYYTGTKDFTYTWNGTVNASSSNQRATMVSGWAQATQSATFQTKVDPKVGTNVCGVLTKGHSGDGAYFNDINCTTGKAYTSSIWVKTLSALPSFYGVLRWKDAASTIIYDDAPNLVASMVVGSWTRLTVSGVAPANATKLQIMWRTLSSHTPTTFYLDGALVIESGSDTEYFDGSTPAAGDFTYVWSGTANASTSYQQAPGLGSWTNRWYGNSGGAGSIYQAKGGLSGTYARKLWLQANTGSTMDAGINPTSNIAVNPNTAYTISAWVRTSVAQNYNFYINWYDASSVLISATPVNTFTAVTSNTWTRVSATGTSPSTAAFALPVIGPYAGGLTMPAGSTMDFDNVLFELAATVRDYFDGSNPIKNMENNPSFETDTVGWTASSLNTGHGRSQTRAYTGFYSVFGVAVDNNSDAMYTNTIPYTVEPGATYTLSAYAWVPTGVVAANFRESARNLWAVAATTAGIPSLVTRGYLDFAKTNQWQRVSTTITIPEGSTKLNIRLYFPANASGMYWDGVLVEKTSALNAYYEGTGDFTYHWAGTTNASRSVQQATKLHGIGYANQADVYRIGTAGSYKARISFNGNTIGDSGANFSSGVSAGASKTYTISMDVTSDIARTVKFSAQGSGTVNSGTSAISIPVGKTRLSWTFTTSGTAPAVMALYLLRADLLMGTLDLDHVLVEEGPSQSGGYFDGTKVEQNLVVNSSFETDASGWWANTGTPTLSASTDRAYLGTKSLKCVSTVTGSDVAVTISANLKADTTYTFSYYVYSVDARTAGYIDIAAANFIVSRAGEKAIPAGVWTRMSATFTTSANIVGSTAFYLHNAGGPTAIGSTIYIDAVLLEEAYTLNQYYEGSGDFTYAWTGTAHQSTSVQRGVAVSRVNSERAFGVSTVRNGDKVLRVIPAIKGNGGGFSPYAGSDVFINLYNQTPTLKPNTTYTIVSTIILEAPLSSGIAKWRVNIDGIDQGSSPFPNTVGEHTMKWQFTTGASAAIAFLRFMPGPSGVAGFTNEVILKNVMIVEGPYTGNYFDGTSAAETDFSYFWTGTAHNSTSYRRGNGVAGMTSGNSLVVHSSEWAASGTKSMRITPTNQYNTTSCILYNNTAGANTPLPLEKGKTYTALATRRLAAPLTGTLSAYAGTISFVQTDIGTAYSPVLPNVAGVAQTRLIFKVDPNVTTWTLRLGHGGSEGSGDVWWDNLTIVEGEYLGDHITGDNPFSKWEGAAKASTAIGYPPNFLSISGKPDREKVGSGALTSTNPAPDFGPRTLYMVYESYGFSAPYQSPGYYGIIPTGRLAVQTQQAGSNAMGVRLDFNNGSSNRVLVMDGGREPGIHVVAITVEDGLTVARSCVDGKADTVSTGIIPGDGWNGNDQIGIGTAQSETAGIRMFVFNAQHDRTTRVAISRYLGNKYGAAVV